MAAINGNRVGILGCFLAFFWIATGFSLGSWVEPGEGVSGAAFWATIAVGALNLLVIHAVYQKVPWLRKFVEDGEDKRN